ncbi:MAG: SHOCT domain-containing protein [Oscillospiraceae bacterium]|nr:SHOCT domain-containing protein [Oscillospiraceae bacterium]
MKRNIRYKPGKASAAMGMVGGIVFVVIGLTMVLPMTFGSGFLPVGLFGLLWTGLAAATVVVNALYLFGKRDHTGLFGRYEITDEEPDAPAPPGPAPTFRPDSPDHEHIAPSGLDPKARLEQLETLKEAGLLTPKEYEAKRQEITKDL